jgi:hypothetical protein
LGSRVVLAHPLLGGGALVLCRHLGVVGKAIELLALVGLDLLDEVEHEQAW